MELNETIRRTLMAGLGAISLTVEKSREVADALIKKGETTAAEKNINYEQVRDQLGQQIRTFTEKLRSDLKQASFDELLERADDLTDEQREILMDRLAHPLKEEEPCGCGEENGGPCDKEDAETPAEPENEDKGE